MQAPPMQAPPMQAPTPPTMQAPPMQAPTHTCVCGVPCADEFCHDCLTKGKRHCNTCRQYIDPRNMVGKICEACHLKEVVFCHTCQKDAPRGHACVLPLVVQCIPAKRVGRPPHRQYVELTKGKKHVLCTLGCKPGTFISNKAWKRHVARKHGGVKKFQCTQCPYKCADSSQFKRHLIKHSDARNFRCHCGKTFRHSEALHAHKKKKHPGTTKHIFKPNFKL